MTKKPPTSLRIPEALRVQVVEWAAVRGLPRNAAYVQLLERGLRPDPVVVKAKPVDPPKAAPVSVSAPLLERKPFVQHLKPGKTKR